jgi:microsomal dipeptidase-like Zn-dependent dipeptidase
VLGIDRRFAGMAATVLAVLVAVSGGIAIGRGGSAAKLVARPTALANRCFALISATTHAYVEAAGGGYIASAPLSRATPFYLKPTGLGTYLLFDRRGLLITETPAGVGATATPDGSTEWAVSHLARHLFAIDARRDGRSLSVDPGSARLTLGAAPAARFEFSPVRGCLDYPEAQVGAFGRPFRGLTPGGKVFGFVDLHVHITADMRAGGEVIYGQSFNRYGIPQALSAAGDAQAHGPNGILDVTGNLIRGTPTGYGDNHGWPTFKGWPTYNTVTHQQVYYVWLKRAWMAGLRLIVAQTVDDHALCEIEPRRDRTCDETQSIIGQIQRLRAMQDYIDAQSGGRGRGWFRLVFDPASARRVIRQGKLAVVIGIESSDLFGCSELLGRPQCTKADIDRGLRLYHRLGVRTLFPVHWVNNAFGGAALESGVKGGAIGALNIAQTGLPFQTETCSRPGEVEQPASGILGPQCNAMGLTPLGAYLIRRMMAMHMLIEADHMSEKMRDSVIAIARAQDYPLISSHNGTGGAWSTSQLSALYRLGGMVSVTPDTAPQLANKILALRRDAVPGRLFGVGLGTDTGGLGSLPQPRADAPAHPLRYPFRSYDGKVEFVRERTGRSTYDLNVEGVAHYGLLADLIADIQQGHGNALALPPLFRSAEAYLEVWQRAVRHS